MQIPARIIENNRRWARERLEKDPDYFRSKVNRQDPDYLWIGCSDSRVMANEICGFDAGELFVHRNVANQAIHTDFNYLSVLQFAVDFLKVKHIIVCGHYGCGGVQAALQHKTIGLADNWLRHIRDLVKEHATDLDMIIDPKVRFDRVVELNVMRQVTNVAATTIVQDAWARGAELSVHGAVYNLSDGKLRDLSATIDEPASLDSIYRI